MMASVSTLARSRGATNPVRMRNACIREALAKPANVDEVTRDARCGRHRGADQMRASSGALSSLEVAVGRRRATLARLEPVVVHRQTHRAAGFAPLEARGGEDAIESFALSLRLHRPRARHHHGNANVVGFSAS